MRIGFVLEETIQVGGNFQQNFSTILALKALRGHEVVVLTNRKQNLKVLTNAGIEAHSYKFSALRKLMAVLGGRSRRAQAFFKLMPSWCGPFDQILEKHNLDIVTCFCFSTVPLYLHNHPFIATVYDISHRENCEFPEVSDIHDFEARERVLRSTLPRAVSVVVNSQLLARDLARFYGVDASRLALIPFLPAIHSRAVATPEEVNRVRKKYGLERPYVFYPAQFWPHKNHVYLLEGLETLERAQGVCLDAVFCGSDYGNCRHVRLTAEKLGMSERVHFLGFIDAEDMSPLYTGALALVMPTYFGPTNLPPLEAISVGCPIVYSDLPQFREDIGDAALYCDLRNPNSLAQQLRKIMTMPETVAVMRQAAEQLRSRAISDVYVDTFQKILDELEYLRRRWR